MSCLLQLWVGDLPGSGGDVDELLCCLALRAVVLCGMLAFVLSRLLLGRGTLGTKPVESGGACGACTRCPMITSTGVCVGAPCPSCPRTVSLPPSMHPSHWPNETVTDVPSTPRHRRA